MKEREINKLETGKAKLNRRKFLKSLLQAGSVSFLTACVPRSRSGSAEVELQQPTISHDVTFVSSPRQEPTSVKKENVINEFCVSVVEETPQIFSKESVSEYNLLSPEAFIPYAAIGGSETAEEEVLDYFPQSYKNAPDSLKGLWSRAIDAKMRDNPQKNTSLAIELEALPNKIYFDYLLVPGGIELFDVQEQDKRILLCDSNMIVVGKLDGEEDFLAIYQEPINNCYYFAKVSNDALGGQKKLAARKNLVAKAFSLTMQDLKKISTEEERKRLYEVKMGDSLKTITVRFGLPSWHSLYGKNFEILKGHPELIREGERLDIPNKFSERQFIDWLTPDFKSFSLSIDGEVKNKDSFYIAETGHYLSGEFLNFYQKYGESLLGYPISELTPDGETQFFENMVLVYSRVDYYSHIPGRIANDGDWHIRPVPIGWNLYYKALNPEVEVLDKFPEIGQFEVDKIFSDFYKQNGGLEIFGFPISGAIKKDTGVIEQWFTNSCLRYNSKNGEIEPAPLGKEYFEKYYANKEYLWAKPRAEEITIRKALEIMRRFPNKLSEIEARTVGVLLFWGSYLESPERTEKRDDLIFEYLAKGEERNFVNTMAILSWHEVRFEMNPVIEKAFAQLAEGSRIINKLIQEKVPAEAFKDNKYPLLPEDWRGKFVFAGGTGFGGLGYEDCPLLFGPYDRFRGYSPNDENLILEALVKDGLHEAIHSFIQPSSKIPHSDWWSEEKSGGPNFVPEDVRKGHLAHMAMCVLTSAAQKHYGFEEERDLRIDYILKVLKQGGIKDPEAEVIRAAVTFNGDRLWKIYESVRKEDDLSMDFLMSTQDDSVLKRS